MVKPTELRLEGLARPVALRRSPRARRLSLRVNEAKLSAVLTMPLHASLGEAGEFLARHLDWLRQRLEELPEPVPFEEGALIPLRGIDHELRLAATNGGRRKVWSEPGNARSKAIDGAPVDLSWRSEPSPKLWVSCSPARAGAFLQNWLRRQARIDLRERVNWHEAKLDVRAERVTIRDQTSRWGSCSAHGTLSFSWRLVLAPAFVLDYVAAHEVAHLRELNHSQRFWRLVRSAAPRTDEARHWLKENGPRLHQYGAAL